MNDGIDSGISLYYNCYYFKVIILCICIVVVYKILKMILCFQCNVNILMYFIVKY